MDLVRAIPIPVPPPLCPSPAPSSPSSSHAVGSREGGQLHRLVRQLEHVFHRLRGWHHLCLHALQSHMIPARTRGPCNSHDLVLTSLYLQPCVPSVLYWSTMINSLDRTALCPTEVDRSHTSVRTSTGRLIAEDDVLSSFTTRNVWARMLAAATGFQTLPGFWGLVQENPSLEIEMSAVRQTHSRACSNP